MAADPGEQADVVDDRALRVVEAQVVRERHAQQARPLRVFHRLPHAEIGAQREQRDELRRPAPEPPSRSVMSPSLGARPARRSAPKHHAAEVGLEAGVGEGALEGRLEDRLAVDALDRHSGGGGRR